MGGEEKSFARLHGIVGWWVDRMIESFWNTDKTHWRGGWYRVKCVWLVANFCPKEKKESRLDSVTLDMSIDLGERS